MGRSISDRLSYRNHYMCSGEATSIYKHSHRRSTRLTHRYMYKENNSPPVWKSDYRSYAFGDLAEGRPFISPKAVYTRTESREKNLSLKGGVADLK